MKFIRISPRQRTIETVEAAEPREAAPDLYARGVDFGVFTKFPGDGGVGYYVYEFGLYADDIAYFSLKRQLYAGDALFFRFDEPGDTIDLGDWRPPAPLWLEDKAAAERAIANRQVERPTASVNGVLVWSWPSPQW